MNARVNQRIGGWASENLAGVDNLECFTMGENENLQNRFHVVENSKFFGNS